MADFQRGMVLTALGQALEARQKADGFPFRPTRIGVGSGTITAGTEETRTQLANQLFSTTRIRARVVSTINAIFEADFSEFASNSPVPWQFREAGLFCESPTNIFTQNFAQGPAHGKTNTAPYSGAIRTPSGLVVLVPYNQPAIGRYDPITGTLADGASVGSSSGVFDGGCLLKDGRVLFAPRGHANIGLYDPTTNVYTNGPAHGAGTAAFSDAVLLPDGRVLLVPYNAANVWFYNPTTNTMQQGPAKGTTQASSYSGGCLLPNGDVAFAGYNGPNNWWRSATNTMQVTGHTVSNSALNRRCALSPDGQWVFYGPGNATTLQVWRVGSDYGAWYDAPWQRAGSGATGIAFNDVLFSDNGTLVLIPNGSPEFYCLNPNNWAQEWRVPHNLGTASPFYRGAVVNSSRILTVPNTGTNLGHFNFGYVADEILYCYGNAGDGFDTIPAHGASAFLHRVLRIPTQIANAQNIQMNISPNPALSVDNLPLPGAPIYSHTDVMANAQMLRRLAAGSGIGMNTLPNAIEVWFNPGNIHSMELAWLADLLVPHLYGRVG